MKNFKAKQIGEITFLYLCAMKILLSETETKKWAKEYARKTTQWGKFDEWRNNATDLYVLLYAIKPEQHEQGAGWYPLNHRLVLNWLREYAQSHPHAEQSRRIFVRLDFDLRINDVVLKNLRRMVMDWDNLESSDRSLVLVRLHMLLRFRASKSELLGHIKCLIDREIELRENINDLFYVQPDGTFKKNADRRSIGVKKDDLPKDAVIIEDASMGASASSNVATVSNGLGSGFDPNGHERSIYPAPKQKPIILKRPSLTEAKPKLNWQPGYYVTHRYTREVIDGPHAQKVKALNARDRWISGEVHYTDGVNWYPFEGSDKVLKPFRAPN